MDDGARGLPMADNVMDMVEAPMVWVRGTQIKVDGVPAGDTRLIEATARPQEIEEFFNILKNKRKLWAQINPGKRFPGVAMLAIDRAVPAVVVKSVMLSANR